MTSRCEHRRSIDGKHLIAVIFERESPEADSPVIEVIYEVRFPSPITNPDAVVPVIRPLTATRTDTRMPVTLTDEEDAYCVERASEKASEIALDS